MSSTKEKVNKRIIFVNSFKGGAGKTTLSMTHCFDSMFNTKEHENVIYLDLDIQGTATSYLFAEGTLPDEENFIKTGRVKKVNINNGKTEKEFYVGYLSPDLKNNAMYGEALFLNHPELAEEMLIQSMIKFIDEQMKKDISTLLVLDCAPGFSNVEQKILRHCYELVGTEGVKIEDEYLVTLDHAHVKKCLQCLKENKRDMDIIERTTKIVINDMHNYREFLRVNGEDGETVIKDIVKKMREEAEDEKLPIWFWKYSHKISSSSVYSRRISIENQVADYLFTKDNYTEQ